MVDANICVYLLAGANQALLARVQDQYRGAVVSSSVAFAEVMVGAARRDAADAALRLFRSIPVLSFDREAALRYADLSFKRGSFDRLIAAHALALDLTLVTNNERDFVDIAGLRIENWTR